MSHRIRPGFTLVEMLTVVVIIGILMAMLVPAIQSARERARQTQCINHQKELASAMTQYETAKEQFPGYANRVGPPAPTHIAASWVVPLLPYLSRNDLWTMWRDGTAHVVSNGAEQGHAFLELLVCPSNYVAATPGNPSPLAYVVNCGMPEDSAHGSGPTATPPGPPDFARNGVFHNHDLANRRLEVKVSATDIKDGAAQTLMLGETLRTTDWAEHAATEVAGGFTWELAGGPDPTDAEHLVGPTPSMPAVGRLKITSDPPAPGQLSSNHSGGAIVTFCDGHTQFLRSDISYRVYQHLMTPNGSEARRQETGPAPKANPANLAGGLSESDYK